ncbi:MAG: Fe2+-dependent dioxygenase [Alphaproteobacteria bacterium]|nr:MAG: Fe2+-dependent dioxygenase [Alphaproteobacteria bacterium]
MYKKVENFFGPQQVANIVSRLSQFTWEDGALTAGAGKNRKTNEQITQMTKSADPLRNHVQQMVLKHPAVLQWAEPRCMARMMFSRYREGAFYGSHNDAAIVRAGPFPFRADISFTIFLNDPSDYEGGELVLETPVGEVVNKEPAGTLVMYDTGLRHRVNEITSGERLVVVGWMESLLRSPEARDVMRDLKSLIKPIVESQGNDSEDAITLRRAIANLSRLLAET